jgi:hypothetical protein
VAGGGSPASDISATSGKWFVGLWICGIGAQFQTPATNPRLTRGRRVVSGIWTLGSAQIPCYSNSHDA